MIVYRELSSLVHDLEVPAGTLYAVSNSLEKHYRPVQLSKESGGFRTLFVPDPLLKTIQRRITQVLLVHMPISPNATAYRYGGSLLRNAAPHAGQPAVLKLDIQHFFDSVLYSAVKESAFPPEIYSEAYGYIMVICAGIVAQVLYNLLASILRALGNSKVPLYFLILAAFLNVVLDLVFIIVFHMGAAGAAYATVISQGVSGAACLIYIFKKVPDLHLKKEDWRLHRDLSLWQIKIGLPMALQYSITAIGTIMVQAALNTLGALSVASFAAASKIEQVVSQAYVALGTTMATYCAQNMGAGRWDRLKKGFSSATVIGSIYAVLAGGAIFLGGKYLVVLFVSEQVGQIMGLADIYLKCAGAMFIPLAVVNIYRNGIQGMGYALLPMMAGVAELIGRGAVALISSRQGSYLGTCMASPAAWILAGALLLAMYFGIMGIRAPGEGAAPGKK